MALAWEHALPQGFQVLLLEIDSLQFIGSKGLTSVTIKKGLNSKNEITIQGDVLLIGGHFSLNWKKIDGQWVIIADHSS